MAMAGLETVIPLFFPLHSVSSSKSLSSPKPPSQLSLKLPPSSSSHSFSLSPPLYLNHYTPTRKLPSFELCCSTVQETAAETETEEIQETTAETEAEETQEESLKRQLFVVNLPFNSSVKEIKNHFGQCGTATYVEIIRQEDGKSKGYGFVTMASGEEAQAAVDKLDSHEFSGRKIGVRFAKRFRKKNSPPPPPILRREETEHKLFVSNLAWKVRVGHLKEFFSDFNPFTTRVVFEGPGKAAGYGFVSFAIREEAEAAFSAKNEKELLGRPVRLKFSEEKSADEKQEDNSGDEKQENHSEDEKKEDNSEVKPEE
ncbi:hypothetical protein Tsubulata_011784 [Turnera subulata]|uniref:RRM domain-containing protein n=1 Tax=Turnera subulata TaxID=218843 RepID=A0A9Q0JN48_9ROSI|nr:hypothetical protein Tsubulata_011784 [Turnera subulata]